MTRCNRQTSYDSVTWNRPRWVKCDEMLSKYVIRWRVYWIKKYIYIDRLIKVIIYSFSLNILISTAGRRQLIPEACDCSLICFYMRITTKIWIDRRKTFRWLFLYFQFIFFMTIISSMLFSSLPPVTSVASPALTFLLPFHQFLVQLTWIRDGFWFADGVISWHRSECFIYHVGFRVTFAHGYLEFTSH